MKFIMYYIRIILVGISTIFWGSLYFLFFWVDLLLNDPVYEFISRGWSRTVLFFCGIKVHFEGLENIDWDKNYVIAGNHLSLMDIPPFIAYFPGKLRWVFKQELASIPIFGWIISIVHISVDRKNRKKSIKSFKNAREKLKKGVSVIIFPEGTRSLTGNVGEFKKGAFIFAIENQIDVAPYAIYGSREVLPPNSTKIEPGEIFISFRKPVSSKNMTYDDRNNLLEKTRNVIIEEYHQTRNKYKDRVNRDIY